MQLVMVNWIAVLLSAIVSTIIGFLWYGPVFGKQWMALMGFSKKDLEKAKKKGMGKTYLINFISTIIMVYVLAAFVVMFEATTFMAGLGVGFWIWLGFIATVALGGVLWEGRPMQLYFINVLYWLVMLLIVGGILGAWQ